MTSTTTSNKSKTNTTNKLFEFENDYPCWGSNDNSEKNTLSFLLDIIKQKEVGNNNNNTGRNVLLLYEDTNYIVLNKPCDLRMDGPYRCTVQKLLNYWYPSPSLLQQVQTVINNSTNNNNADNNNSVDDDDNNSKKKLLDIVESSLHKHNDLIDNTLRPVHQLDYATSGVLLIARNKRAAAVACDSFSKRQTNKTYVALVNGHISCMEDIPVFQSKEQVISRMNQIEKNYLQSRESKKLQRGTYVGYLPPPAMFDKWKSHTIRKRKKRKRQQQKAPEEEANATNSNEQQHQESKKKKTNNKNKAKFTTTVLDTHEFDKMLNEFSDDDIIRFSLDDDDEEKLIQSKWKDIKDQQPLTSSSSSSSPSSAMTTTASSSSKIDNDNEEEEKKEKEQEIITFHHVFERMANEYNTRLKERNKRNNNADYYNNENNYNNNSNSSNSNKTLPTVFRIAKQEKEHCNNNNNNDEFYTYASCAQNQDDFKMKLHPDAALPTSSSSSSLITSLLPSSKDELNDLDYKPALTKCTIIERGYLYNNNQKVTKVQLEPYTGRRHQLRLHMVVIGHPIVGDTTYEGTISNKQQQQQLSSSPRMCLHAHCLSINLLVDNDADTDDNKTKNKKAASVTEQQQEEKTFVAPDPFDVVVDVDDDEKVEITTSTTTTTTTKSNTVNDDDVVKKKFVVHVPGGAVSIANNNRGSRSKS